MIPAAAGLLVLVALGWLLLRALGRELELARLAVRDGAVELIRGRLPPRLLGDLRDVVASVHVARAELRIVVEDRRPRLVTSGLDEDTAQQLRNVVGTYTLSRLRAGTTRR